MLVNVYHTLASGIFSLGSVLVSTDYQGKCLGL